MEQVSGQLGGAQAKAAEVYLTSFSSVEVPWLVDRAALLLNEQELMRATRMRVAGALSEFVLSRALLRSLLSQRLGCGVQEIPLVAEPQHKPYLSEGRTQLDFNLAHAHGRIGIALTPGVACGIDLEFCDPDVEFLDIACGHFAAAERAALLRAGGRAEAVAAAFYRIWTRKEAVVKAAGDGLTLPLDNFDVSPARPEELSLWINSVESGPSTWHVRDLAAPETFAAALAMGQPGLAVKQYVLNEDDVVGLLDGVSSQMTTRVA